MRRYAAIGTFIADARRRAGLRQVDVAERVGITQVYFAHIEQGRKRPSGTTAKAIGMVLGINLRPLWEAQRMVHRQSWE